MSTEFKDITIAKPDPQQVQKINSTPGPNRYRFPFTCSSNPPKEWIKMFEMEWRAKIAKWVNKGDDLKAVGKALPPRQYIHPSVDIEERIIGIECEIQELPPLSEYFTASVDATNQRYKEMLKQNDEEQRAIREAIDAIKLP